MLTALAPLAAFVAQAPAAAPARGLFAALDPAPIIATIVYFVLGCVLFGAAFWVIEHITPFSIRKEIEEDQNVALAILLGAVFLSLAIILAAVIATPS